MNFDVESGDAIARPVILFVLGMGRSGTSALTRVLSLCGATLPSGMMGADAGNPRGYWEPRAALQLNEKFLYGHGSTYFDPTLRLQADGALSNEEKASFVAKIGAYLHTLPAAPVVLIKDLHVSVLSGMWFEATRRAGFDIAAVIAVRHPQEVSASLSKLMRRDSPELSGALWLKYNLLAERATRHLPRVFVEYANFLDDWRREVKRISNVLPIDLDAGDGVAVEEFLEPNLRRQRERGRVTEPFGTDWLSVAYEDLSTAARDDPWDQSELDRILAQYEMSERGFRMVHDDFHYAFDNLRFRFSRKFMRPLYEGFAIAHGRKGTWA
ncbi:MAG: hypothetical protein QOK18_2980 [Mycobacterium sp.]|nr:hypothetical protein [Mycobacterium sp.]MDT7756260.1 hypothetical protein [Mycobacterium sp.]